MKSPFYYQGHHTKIAFNVKQHLNSLEDNFPTSINSPRALGDTYEDILRDDFRALLGNWCKNYSNDFARRAMADIAFTDVNGFYSMIDVKTHNENTNFNMPNLTSVERLTRLYESDMDFFSLLIIKYSINNNLPKVSEVIFSPIEFIDWNCLTLGALGWGQIQIANSNRIEIAEHQSRKFWMLKLCDNVLEFYSKEIDKIIGTRIKRFEEIKKYWKNKDDIWL